MKLRNFNKLFEIERIKIVTNMYVTALFKTLKKYEMLTSLFKNVYTYALDISIVSKFPHKTFLILISFTFMRITANLITIKFKDTNLTL